MNFVTIFSELNVKILQNVEYYSGTPFLSGFLLFLLSIQIRLSKKKSIVCSTRNSKPKLKNVFYKFKFTNILSYSHFLFICLNFSVASILLKISQIDNIMTLKYYFYYFCKTWITSELLKPFKILSNLQKIDNVVY